MSPADYRHSSFASGIWIGGVETSGQLRIAGQTYRQGGIDFYPGPIRPGGNTCGVLFQSLRPPFEQGVKRLANGKILLTYETGFQIYDPFSNTLTTNGNS